MNVVCESGWLLCAVKVLCVCSCQGGYLVLWTWCISQVVTYSLVGMVCESEWLLSVVEVVCESGWLLSVVDMVIT